MKRILVEMNSGKMETQIDVSNLPPGFYQVVLLDERMRRIGVGRFLKE